MVNWQRWILGSVIIAMAAATIFVAGFGIGHYVIPSREVAAAATAEKHEEEFRLFWEAWRVLEEQFYTQEPLDPQAMTYGAIRGMVASLEDRHTAFMDPVQADLFKEDLDGSFGGIGATVNMTDEGLLRVTKPLPGSPAEEAGLQVGDIIVEVDGQSIQGMDLVKAIMLIRGPEDTAVRLLVRRVDGSTSQLTIRRGIITVPTTEARFVEDGIAYLALWECNGRAPQEVDDALAGLMRDDPIGLVLDLRGNPGGFLYVAKEIASQFLDRGLLLLERSSDGSMIRHEAQPGGLATDIPLVVLVDGGSASAAEIIAGAIQDTGRGILIGEQTFGKGSVQTTERLSDGSALQITIRRWFTPNDRQIQGEGLTPDVEVVMDEEDLLEQRDLQLERAILYLRGLASS